MRMISEYRDKDKVDLLLRQIKKINNKSSTYRFMEICGTHTMSISKFGVRTLLPENIELISGPGCPLCVTSQGEIDAIFEMIINYKPIVVTYGDLLKVPGSNGESLLKLKSMGYDIRVVFSPLDTLKIAKDNPNREIVFLSIGFETTTPPTAALVKMLEKHSINNVFIFVMNKTMPNILDFIIKQEIVKLDGFICPGHVSVITGELLYKPLVDNNFACAIAGFEPVDILLGIYSLIEQVNSGVYYVKNTYKRVVKSDGNHKALELLEEVFEPTDAFWRGIGLVMGSGLKLKRGYERYDAINKYGLKINHNKSISGCKCGEILLGLKKPYECGMFAKYCTPENPVGPCMVSSEGTCAAFYKYERVAL
ncbi:hydrogenase formation protein HypD [Deferribacter thermophilus]|uniref:hydrogenase formation protein HypD n=1 Tax=Deferribacter thermophilus TaxID=53573 RepID=UPI003C178F1C